MAKRAAWSAAFGFLATVFGAVAIAWWLAPADLKLPRAPAYAFTAVTLVSLYCVFAALLGWWPCDRLARAPDIARPGLRRPRGGFLGAGPRRANPFVARAELPLLLEALLHSDGHPVAVVGMGGAGKTGWLARRCTTTVCSGGFGMESCGSRSSRAPTYFGCKATWPDA